MVDGERELGGRGKGRWLKMNHIVKASAVAPMVVPMKTCQFVDGDSWKRLEDQIPCLGEISVYVGSMSR